MNKQFLVILLAGCTALVTGCSIIQEIPVEAIPLSGSQAIEEVPEAEIPAQQPQAPSAYLQIGSAGLFVNGDGMESETLCKGITIYYGSTGGQFRMEVAPEAADLIQKHYISLEAAQQLEQGQTIAEVSQIAEGREPLYYQDISKNRDTGFGYYFVTNGRVVLVNYVRGITDHVAYVGTLDGVLFSADEEYLENDEENLCFLIGDDDTISLFEKQEDTDTSSVDSSSAASSKSSASSAASKPTTASSTASKAAVSTAPSAAPPISNSVRPPVASTAPPAPTPSAVQEPPVTSQDTTDDYDPDEIAGADVTVE